MYIYTTDAIKMVKMQHTTYSFPAAQLIHALVLDRLKTKKGTS